MSTISYPHISVDPDGTARVGKTRYKVLHLAAEHFHYGWSAEEMLRQHPDLRPEEVYAALTYFYDHRSQMVAMIEGDAVELKSIHTPAGVSRDELLRRRKDAS